MTDAHDQPSSSPRSGRGAFLAPPPDAVPGDRCFRCGRKTEAGSALCEEHNPGRIRGPSSTQMHATILGGVAIGVLGFLLLMRVAASSDGPFEVQTMGAGIGADGGVSLAFSIVNQGEGDSIADCRVTRDGIPRPDDLAFRTMRLPAGKLVYVERIVPEPPAGSAQYVPERVTVVCS